MRNLTTMSLERPVSHTGRTNYRLLAGFLALSLFGALAVLPAGAQTVPKPGAVDSGPLPAPGAGTGDQQAPAPLPAPQSQGGGQQAAGAPAQTADLANSTLGPAPSDPGSPDELTIAPKPEVFVEGEAGWDDALATIRQTQKKVKDGLDKAGVKIVGRPLTRFVKTTDDKFNFEIGYPVEIAGAQPSLPSDFKLGTTPSGAAVRFTHHGSYDDIDGTYEAITVDLDAKGIDVNDAFLEEYINDVADSSDPELEIYIYVFKK